jgi:CTP synthase
VLFGGTPKQFPDTKWLEFIEMQKKTERAVKIGIAGKYFSDGQFILSDSYISVIEAIKHAAWFLGCKPEIEWLDAEKFESDSEDIEKLHDFDGINIPGGFGKRGAEGKIKVIEFVRKNNIPFLGLCYGLQLAVIEFARNVCGLTDANSTEINPGTPYPVICTMEEQKENVEGKGKLGGTMRLGSYPCQLHYESRSYQLYTDAGRTYSNKVFMFVDERHRHRYEVNNKFVSNFLDSRLRIAGLNTEKNLVEIIEFADHPFFVATQFHPEFLSRPLDPHPLFVGFVETAAMMPV